MDSVARWTIGDEPVFVTVPDSADRAMFRTTEKHQRYVNEATVLRDGRVVLLYGLFAPDSILLHVCDPASGEEVLIPAPVDGRPPAWGHANMIAHDGQIILRDNNRPPRIHRVPEAQLQADRRGGFSRPPSQVDVAVIPRVDQAGILLGAFPDGSLVVVSEARTTDTTIVWSTVAVRPAEIAGGPSDAPAHETLFETASPTDPSDRGMPASWAHQPRFTSAVAGDTIWIVPTERPELLAVHRSGDVLLRVEWHAGDRSLPRRAAETRAGPERFPAAARLRKGADGLIYVQRVSARGDRLRRGPEWLVFSPAGELVARLDIPGRWPATEVLTFGDGAVVIRTQDDESGVQEIRIHNLRR